jgi:hypothetical protein
LEIVLILTWVMWNLVLSHLVKLLVSAQDRCTVCAKRNMGLEIILEDMMKLLGDDAQVDP